jgi:NADPH:quinone reductase-like Zn-dependent oxidoreductase
MVSLESNQARSLRRCRSTVRIQTLKRLKPALFRQDVIALFDLLRQKKIKPLIAQRFSLAEARRAQELLEKGGVTGKIVLESSGNNHPA